MIDIDKIYNEDCLSGMKRIPDKSIDCIICDLPYGKLTDKTRAKWDVDLDYNFLFSEYRRLIKPHGVICLHGNEPFSSFLRMGMLDIYKYDIKWIKSKTTGFANANYRPMNKYEDIMVFSYANASAGGKSNPMTYNPQGIVECGKVKKNSARRHGLVLDDTNNIGSGNMFASSETEYVQKYTNYPENVVYFDNPVKYVHPTQKPVELVQYLVRTYTNEGDLVLDNCMGSGTTAIACIREKRHFIGFELDPKYHVIAVGRIEAEQTMENL